MRKENNLYDYDPKYFKKIKPDPPLFVADVDQNDYQHLMNDDLDMESFADIFQDKNFEWDKEDQEVVAEHEFLQMEAESRMEKKQKKLQETRKKWAVAQFLTTES